MLWLGATGTHEPQGAVQDRVLDQLLWVLSFSSRLLFFFFFFTGGRASKGAATATRGDVSGSLCCVGMGLLLSPLVRSLWSLWLLWPLWPFLLLLLLSAWRRLRGVSAANRADGVDAVLVARFDVVLVLLLSRWCLCACSCACSCCWSCCCSCCCVGGGLWRALALLPLLGVSVAVPLSVNAPRLRHGQRRVS